MDKFKKIIDSPIINNKITAAVLIILTALYPLRWAQSGLDLWDIGYSCGNYVNFNTVSISRPWFFSTYLSLLTGHILSLLPYGSTLTGLKIYCGLVVSLTVVISSLFCIRKLKYPVIFVILGEVWAVSICYVPTVILYNHLTYLLLIAAIVLLYTGLSSGKDICLAFSGTLLSLNIFVRISNAPQVLLIAAVWYYLFLAKSPVNQYVKKTLVFISGYAVTLITTLSVVAYKYGLSDYVSGIRGMLDISSEAGDYSAGSMVKEVILAYAHGGSRLVYIVVFALLGSIIYRLVSRKSGKEDKKDTGNGIASIVTLIISAGLILFLIIRKILVFNFYHYATVYYSAALFLVIADIVCILNMADKELDKEGKLISLFILLQMIVMSIGSGTGISPVMNSAFIAGPFIFFNLYRYGNKYLAGPKAGRRVAAGVAGIALAVFFIQALAFGALYEFEEAGNGAGGRYRIEGNRVLGNTRTSKERADLMQGLTDHVHNKGLRGRSVIVYGYAPALAFYLDLKPAITSWPDLDSYGLALMEKDISDLKNRIVSGDSDFPLIIIDEEGAIKQREGNPAKWEMISGFMGEYGYSSDYSDGRFAIYTCDKGH